MKFNFRCQGHVIMLIMRMTRLSIQTKVEPNKARNPSSLVSRLSLVEFPVCKSAIQLFTNQLVLHLCRRKETLAVDEFSQEI